MKELSEDEQVKMQEKWLEEAGIILDEVKFKTPHDEIEAIESVSALVQDRDSYKESFENCLKERDSLKEQLEKQKTEFHRRLDQQAEEASKLLESSERENKELMSDIDKIASEYREYVNKSESQLSSLKEQLEIGANQYGHSEATNEILTNDLLKLKDQSEARKQTIETMQSKYEKLEEQADKLEGALEVTNDYESLSDEDFRIKYNLNPRDSVSEYSAKRIFEALSNYKQFKG